MMIIFKRLPILILILSLFLFLPKLLKGQDINKQVVSLIYNPKADAHFDLKVAKEHATKSKKNIIIFVGGNWCIWCKRLDQFLNNDIKLKQALGNYEVMHINYSKENKNEAILNTLNNPQQFGFPVIVILNQKGEYLHTQNTGDLENGNSYSVEKITAFLNNWNNINHK
ncbi:MAG TPA: thioredoxin family protein [Edaphocola sp.]|nr:thioredoxin family protein [Edaphocola sp.]